MIKRDDPNIVRSDITKFAVFFGSLFASSMRAEFRNVVTKIRTELTPDEKPLTMRARSQSGSPSQCARRYQVFGTQLQLISAASGACYVASQHARANPPQSLATVTITVGIGSCTRWQEWT